MPNPIAQFFSGQHDYIENLNVLLAALEGSQPVPGEVRQYCGITPPSGWAFCDGAALSSTSYPDLHAVLGIRYGSAGAGTFRLPNIPARALPGAIISGIRLGDVFSVMLPGDVTVSHVATADDTPATIAAILAGGIGAAPGYDAMGFTVSNPSDEVVLLTGKVAGVAFSGVTYAAPTAPGYSTVTPASEGVAQVDEIVVSDVRAEAYPPVQYIIKL